VSTHTDAIGVQLGVNIDHVATVRNARYPDASDPSASGAEPDPARAAHEAELGGADSITIHLREDRRHIRDRDAELLRRMARVRLNLEMAPTDEMVGIATRIRPHTVMLVPEGRREVTTEGGLNLVGDRARLGGAVERLKEAGIVVSAFVDADEDQVACASDLGFDVCEIHTGPYADAFRETGGDPRRVALREAVERVDRAGKAVTDRGLRFNAGHALNYHNTPMIAALSGLRELHIGHAIVSRAVFVGLRGAVASMKDLIHRACAGA